VETDKHDERMVANSPREAADVVVRWLKQQHENGGE
jgi:flagellar biosynthesis/type III secretory pathway M-ring protein FliF/YscJ